MSSMLNQLTLSQLKILLGHLKMGETHLAKYLTSSQLKNLLEINKISKAKKTLLKSNIIEQHGNIILLINTIFTSILGGALGFSAFASFEIATPPILFVMSGLIATIGAFTARMSYSLTSEKAKHAINQQKLLSLQIKVLHVINEKLRVAIQELVDSLNQFTYLPKEEEEELFFLKSHYLFAQKLESIESIYYWLDSFEERINEIKKNRKPALTEQQTLKLNEVLQQVEELIQNEAWLNNLLASQRKQEPENANHEEDDSEKNESVLAVLTDPYAAPPKVQFKHKPWWKENYRDIIVGLFPTFLGGGASLFVFLTGIPDIAKRLEWHFFYNFMTSPLIKKIQLYLFFSITLYFGFIYLYNQRKNFQRNQQLILSQQALTQQEISHLNLERRWNSLKNLYHHIEKLQLILEEKAPDILLDATS